MPNRVIPAQRESRDLELLQFLNISENQGLDSRLRGNDGVGRPYLNLL